MKRFLLASALIVGALFLFFGSQSATTVSAQQPDYCGIEGFDVPDSGRYFDFSEACFWHDGCWERAQTQADLFLCDQEFLADMLESCDYAPYENGTFTGAVAVQQRNSAIGKFICRQIAQTYYLGVRLASITHNFDECHENGITATAAPGCFPV